MKYFIQTNDENVFSFPAHLIQECQTLNDLDNDIDCKSKIIPLNFTLEEIVTFVAFTERIISKVEDLHTIARVADYLNYSVKCGHIIWL